MKKCARFVVKNFEIEKKVLNLQTASDIDLYPDRLHFLIFQSYLFSMIGALLNFHLSIYFSKAVVNQSF